MIIPGVLDGIRQKWLNESMTSWPMSAKISRSTAATFSPSTSSCRHSAAEAFVIIFSRTSILALSNLNACLLVHCNSQIDLGAAMRIHCFLCQNIIFMWCGKLKEAISMGGTPIVSFQKKKKNHRRRALLFCRHYVYTKAKRDSAVVDCLGWMQSSPLDIVNIEWDLCIHRGLPCKICCQTFSPGGVEKLYWFPITMSIPDNCYSLRFKL